MSAPSSLPLGRLFGVAARRVVWRAIDGLCLLPRRRLRRLWWAGLTHGPSPYLSAFALRLTSQQHHVPEQDLTWGEAFVVPTRRVLRRFGLRAGQVLVDLGCGRGAVLVASSSLGLITRGLELLPDHVTAIGAAAAAAAINVEVGDARTIDEAALDGVDAVWLSWATWSAASRTAVGRRLRALKPGALVFGVVYGIVDDDDGDGDDAFATVATATLPFSWGRADVVVSRRRPPS